MYLIRFQNYLNSFVHLFFTDSCRGCNQALIKREHLICTSCLYHLPLTNHHLDPQNNTAQQLIGKVDFEQAFSMLHFTLGGMVESFIHKLKYTNDPEIGYFLGHMYGLTLKKTTFSYDAIIPVPLHPTKEKKRGYNQAEEIAQGLSTSLNIPIITNSLIRVKNNTSQTLLHRQERYDNVENIFECYNIQDLTGKHILLIDDVITTGATIASAGNTLLKNTDCKVSIMTLARA